ALSANYTFHSGDTWTPRTTCLLTPDGKGGTSCHDFPQGPVLYFAEPRGSRRIKERSELDMRAEYQHAFWWGRQFRVDFDMFNVLSQKRETSVETLVGPDLGA